MTWSSAVIQDWTLLVADETRELLPWEQLRGCWTKKSICVVDCGVIQILQRAGPHPGHTGIHLLLSVYAAVIFFFFFIMILMSQQEIRGPRIHWTCCGRAWQISTLLKCWISVDVCPIRTAGSFPDLANRSFWYNGTFTRLSVRNSFSSDLLFSFQCLPLASYVSNIAVHSSHLVPNQSTLHSEVNQTALYNTLQCLSFKWLASVSAWGITYLSNLCCY